ncbi:MAG: EAL domain-containing protein [Acetobacteraceae bacterium]|nr:EAL domain-containing protein [Acetobacteraceae bacterium]
MTEASRELCPTCPALGASDPLTGLAERRRLTAALSEYCAAGDVGALLLLDLDGFKAVNDTLGHQAGDQLLKAVARRISQTLRASDLAARLGGDEFAFLLTSVDAAGAQAVGQRIVNLLARPFLISGQVATVGGSIGYVVLPAEARTAEDALRFADLALYEAKATGRGRVVPYDPELRHAAEARLLLEQDLRAALPLGQIALAHQTIHRLDDLSVSGTEALARWFHPSRGPVRPDIFIPLAERAGLIQALGEWVLLAACEEAVGMTGDRCVSVNVAGPQFEGGMLPRLVTEALRRTGLPARRLTLEVTETALLPKGHGALDQLRAIQAMGVAIALDDFGVGHSSLGLLQRFAFETIKVDRRFVASACEDPRSAAIIRGIAAMAHGLGIRCVAEGVETEAQLRFLRDAGCDEAQGYRLGRPVPAAELPFTIEREKAA